MFSKANSVADDINHKRHYKSLGMLLTLIFGGIAAYYLLNEMDNFAPGYRLGYMFGAGMSYAVCVLMLVLAYVRADKSAATLPAGADIARHGLLYAAYLLTFSAIVPAGVALAATYGVATVPQANEVLAAASIEVDGNYALGAIFGAVFAHAINATSLVAVCYIVILLGRRWNPDFGRVRALAKGE